MLITFLSGNPYHFDIAQTAGRDPLQSPSESETSDSDMDEGSGNAGGGGAAPSNAIQNLDTATVAIATADSLPAAPVETGETTATIIKLEDTGDAAHGPPADQEHRDLMDLDIAATMAQPSDKIDPSTSTTVRCRAGNMR